MVHGIRSSKTVDSDVPQSVVVFFLPVSFENDVTIGTHYVFARTVKGNLSSFAAGTTVHNTHAPQNSLSSFTSVKPFF
jgi:hypothetical protein